MSWVEIEKQLEVMEQIESYTREEQATFIASLIADIFPYSESLGR